MSVRDYDRIERAIYYVQAHQAEQPTLEALARHLALSPFHAERLFKRWAGVTPKRFLQTLTLNHAKRLLADSASVLEAAYDSGLSGGSRLHDLFVTVDAVTPGEFKRLGEGLTLRWGVHDTPFGRCFLAVTTRGVCALAFIEAGREEQARDDLKAAWPGAEVVEDPSATQPFVDAMVAHAQGEEAASIPVLLRGTNFQLKVWEALLRIPPGHVLAYDDVAALIGQPRATRAVASAIAHNPVGYLIPCHRVLRKTGALGGYRWGPARKAAILAWETMRQETEAA